MTHNLIKNSYLWSRHCSIFLADTSVASVNIQLCNEIGYHSLKYLDINATNNNNSNIFTKFDVIYVLTIDVCFFLRAEWLQQNRSARSTIWRDYDIPKVKSKCWQFQANVKTADAAYILLVSVTSFSKYQVSNHFYLF